LFGRSWWADERKWAFFIFLQDWSEPGVLLSEFEELFFEFGEFLLWGVMVDDGLGHFLVVGSGVFGSGGVWGFGESWLCEALFIGGEGGFDVGVVRRELADGRVRLWDGFGYGGGDGFEGVEFLVGLDRGGGEGAVVGEGVNLVMGVEEVVEIGVGGDGGGVILEFTEEGLVLFIEMFFVGL
jgi:hypothetical protein